MEWDGTGPGATDTGPRNRDRQRLNDTSFWSVSVCTQLPRGLRNGRGRGGELKKIYGPGSVSGAAVLRRRMVELLFLCAERVGRLTLPSTLTTVWWSYPGAP